MNRKLIKLIHFLSGRTESRGRHRTTAVHPASLLVTAFVGILLCSMSENAIYTVTVLAVLLMVLATRPARVISTILSRILLPVIFTSLILLPSVFMGHPSTLLTVVMKVFTSLLIIGLVSEALEWSEFSDGLRALHFPGILIMILDHMIRYLVILGRYCSSVLDAAAVRCVGRQSWKNRGTGGIIGLTALKAQKTAAETQDAMACRLFEGEYRTIRKRGIRAADIFFLLLIPAMIAYYIYTQGMIR